MLHVDSFAKEELGSKSRLPKAGSNRSSDDGEVFLDSVGVIVVGEYGGALRGVKVLGVKSPLGERSAGGRNKTSCGYQA